MVCPAIGAEQATQQAAQQAGQGGGCGGGAEQAAMQAQNPCGGSEQSGKENQGGGCGGGSGPYSASAIQAMIEGMKDEAQNQQTSAIQQANSD